MVYTVEAERSYICYVYLLFSVQAAKFSWGFPLDRGDNKALT